MVTAVALFAGAVIVVLLVGPRMASTADRLGQVTGLGGGLFGLVFLALATDLPEITLTPAAVLSGSPRIALGNLLGSAAAQLALIAVVDIAVREGKLYGRLPLPSSIGQCAVMLSVLSVPLVAAAGTPSFGGVSVATLVLPLAYLGVLAAIRGIGADHGIELEPHEADPAAAQNDAESTGDSTGSLWLRFAGFAVLLAGAGVALESGSEMIGSAIGLGETAAGAPLAGIVTSLPELVTAGAAARLGAIDLAVGNLVGSAALDVALLSWADVFYTEGSVFALLGAAEFTLIGMTLALTALLVVGLARGESQTSRRVGMESYLMVAVYVIGAAVLVSA